ncbi:hypothetical protein [Haemophilus parainfluenzae]|jgi:hypothetical protein|uniref:hypothetical protein n=1 Tax=Haemophilus parainfluenzae TaxID=729 RepID=UPI00066D608C|nr:hypothetical protein [Haemophilus parainfluenzae]DAS60552.1 MAG TPA: hypothetical protein [Bacteriophage sp.]
MKNLNQQLNHLTPSADWITTKLQDAYDNLNQQLNIVVDDKNGFFAVAIAYQQACDQKPEVADKMQRIASLIVKRANQIEKRRKALINSLTITEQEQLIIA